MLIPIGLIAAPVVALPFVERDETAAAAFQVAWVLHVVGALWLLWRAPPKGWTGARLAGLRLAIGSPSALYVAVMVTSMIVRDSDGWMVLPFVLLPALCVWPFVFVAMAQDRRRAHATRP